MINLINNAVLKSIKNILNVNHIDDKPEQKQPLKPEAFIVSCSLNGLNRELHFLISLPKPLINGLMTQFIELHHAGLDHAMLTESIVSEIGNLTSCELSTHPDMISELGKSSISVPSVYQWNEGKLPHTMTTSSQLLVDEHPIHIFCQLMSKEEAPN